jgi:membrane protein implicated in regulation of membrane protease activity
MAKIKIEDIVFWLIIIAMIVIAIWKMFGSPTDASTLVAIIIFTAMSEILLWKAIFSMDKRTAIGFNNIKNSIINIEKDINSINTKLDTLIKRKH